MVVVPVCSDDAVHSGGVDADRVQVREGGRLAVVVKAGVD